MNKVPPTHQVTNQSPRMQNADRRQEPARTPQALVVSRQTIYIRKPPVARQTRVWSEFRVLEARPWMTAKQSVANICIFKYICEHSSQIIFLFVFTVKKILINIHIRIRRRLRLWIIFSFVFVQEKTICFTTNLPIWWRKKVRFFFLIFNLISIMKSYKKVLDILLLISRLVGSSNLRFYYIQICKYIGIFGYICKSFDG